MTKLIIFDLDGTVYLGEKEVSGAVDYIKECHAKGIRTMFVTNRSNRVPELVVEQLRGYGIPCELEDVMTTALASAAYIQKPSKVYIIGEEGLRIALENAGHTVVEDEQPDYVVVSIDREFTYAKLAKAADYILKGAKFIATNPDHRLHLNGRVCPGSGTIVAAVETATDVKPIMLGKPERALIDAALEAAGVSSDEAIAIGDNLETDIPAAAAAGVRSVLILTGYSKREDCATAKVKPDFVVADYAELSQLVL